MESNGAVEITKGDGSYDLSSILLSSDRDYLVRNNGDQVKVGSFKGKIVGLYFSASWCGPCRRFTPNLVEVYNELQQHNNFEIVFVSGDEDEESFDAYFSKMPWLAIPFSDTEARKQVDALFAVSGIPHLVIMDADGKVLTNEGVEIIQEYEAEAYPFSSQHIEKLKEQEAAAKTNQSLKTLLVSQSRDHVISADGKKVPVSDLVGKTVLLYFSAHWCPPCRAFLPALTQTYKELKEKGKPLEVIFISSDRDQASFDEFFSKMPWLALPFGDKRKQSLSRSFKVRGIPMVVAVGPTGKTVSTDAREQIMCHGAEAYPFSEERIKEIEESYEKMAEGWPEKVKHASHDHGLTLTKRQFFNCDGCSEEGRIWSYYCDECDFDLHPKCALHDEGKVGEGGGGGKAEGRGEGGEEKATAEGWICDGEKCYKE